MGEVRIEPGIGRELADKGGAFERTKKPARASTHIYSPMVSTSRSSLPVLDFIEGKIYGHRQRHRQQDEGQQEVEDFDSEFNLDETTFESEEDSM